MLKFKRNQNTGLALPESTPVTLVQVDTANLPYACHCPMCGGIFQIPEALLYRVEEDEFLDGVSDAEFIETKGGYASSGAPAGPETASIDTTIDTAVGGEEDVTTL